MPLENGSHRVLEVLAALKDICEIATIKPMAVVVTPLWWLIDPT